MFLVFPYLLPRMGLWPTLMATVSISAAALRLLVILIRRIGIELF
jgi:hypothetical protein